MSNPKHEKQDWLNNALNHMLFWVEVPESGYKNRRETVAITKQQIISKIEEMIDNIENSVKQHTVPEGTDLVTRSYVLNTIEFERKRLKGEV